MPTFTRASELLAWAEDEYLSALLLRAIRPKPGKVKGGKVDFEWGLLGEDEGKVALYPAHAEGVTTWTLEGDWDKHQELELSSIEDRPGGLCLVQSVPGKLTLVCKSLTVERGEVKRYRPPPRPDDSRILFWGARELTWKELLEWIAPPAGLTLFRQEPKKNVPVDPATFGACFKGPHIHMYRLQAEAKDEQPWLFISWMLTIGKVGHYFSLSRGTADAETWKRLERLPEKLGPGNVMSGSIKVSSDEWLAKWAKP